jgi:hypothetical protein
MKALTLISNVLAVTVLAGCGLTFIALIVLCAGAKLTGLIA